MYEFGSVSGAILCLALTTKLNVSFLSLDNVIKSPSLLYVLPQSKDHSTITLSNTELSIFLVDVANNVVSSPENTRSLP